MPYVWRRVDPSAAKTKRPRTIAVTGPLREIITRRHTVRRLDCSLVFHRVSKGRPGRAPQHPSDDDLRDAVEKVSTYVQSLPADTDRTQTEQASVTDLALCLREELAEAGGNRTHRSGGQPGAGRL